MTARVLVAGGGRGRHVFPGVAVVRELMALGAEVHWMVMGGNEDDKVVRGPGIAVESLLAGRGGDQAGGKGQGPRDRRLAVEESPSRLPRALLAALGLMLRLRPVAVLGVGGVTSSLGILAAGMVGVPAVLLEHDAIPSRASRLLGPWADLICCGFADAVNGLPSLAAEWTGNPVRRDFFEVPEIQVQEPRRVLVMTGSDGSLFLNRVIPRALALLRDRGVVPAVRHQAGLRWTQVVRTSYRDHGLEATVIPSLAEPWQALAETDLVVARSGAMNVSELAASGRGALLIPFPESLDNRQELNARSLERAGGAMVITELKATPEHVAGLLEALLSDADELATMARRSRDTALPGAARRIAERLLSVGGVA